MTGLPLQNILAQKPAVSFQKRVTINFMKVFFKTYTARRIKELEIHSILLTTKISMSCTLELTLTINDKTLIILWLELLLLCLVRISINHVYLVVT